MNNRDKMRERIAHLKQQNPKGGVDRLHYGLFRGAQVSRGFQRAWDESLEAIVDALMEYSSEYDATTFNDD